MFPGHVSSSSPTRHEKFFKNLSRRNYSTVYSSPCLEPGLNISFSKIHILWLLQFWNEPHEYLSFHWSHTSPNILSYSSSTLSTPLLLLGMSRLSWKIQDLFRSQKSIHRKVVIYVCMCVCVCVSLSVHRNTYGCTHIDVYICIFVNIRKYKHKYP